MSNPYIREGLPTILPMQPFEGFQGGPTGGRWYCTAFHPVPADWDLPVSHPEARLIGQHISGMYPHDYVYIAGTFLCPYCGCEFEQELS